MRNKVVTEGFDDLGMPTLKYYAFDWDDNLMFMPTKIIVESSDGDEVGMSTEDFATYRSMIGKEPFDYKGKSIVGFSSDPFRNFGTKGDKKFLLDSMKAKAGPAWADFVEAVNNGSIFSIITARGHNPATLKEAVYNMIVSNHRGLNKDLLIKNLVKFRDFADDEKVGKQDLIREYMDLLKFYPVTYGQEDSASSPEELKVVAMKDFISYVKEQSAKLGTKVFLKNGIKNKFIPQIGFSDDDIKNVKVMKKEFEDEPSLKTYSTAGGIKTRY